MVRKIYLDIRGNFGLGDYLCMDPLLTKLQEVNNGKVIFLTKFPPGNLTYRGDVRVLASDEIIETEQVDEIIKIYGYKELGNLRYQKLERMKSLIGHMCSYANLEPGETRPGVYLVDSDFDRIPSSITKKGLYVACCTDFSDVRRHLPISKWTEFIQGAHARGFKVILVGQQPLRRQLGIFGWLKIRNSVAFDFQGKLSIRETAALISKCTVFVGNNSGLFHYAQAVDTKCVVTMSVNNPMRFLHPGGPSVEYVISDHLPCIRCTNRSLDYIVNQGCVAEPKGLCMRELTAEMLIEKLLKITGKKV